MSEDAVEIENISDEVVGDQTVEEPKPKRKVGRPKKPAIVPVNEEVVKEVLKIPDPTEMFNKMLSEYQAKLMLTAEESIKKINETAKAKEEKINKMAVSAEAQNRANALKLMMQLTGKS